MTEAQWHRSADGVAMLGVVLDRGSPRLWRLLAVACVRQVADEMRYQDSVRALVVAERYADAWATHEELLAARFLAEAAAQQALRDEFEDEIRGEFHMDAEYAAVLAARRAADAVLPCVADEVDSTSLDPSLLYPDLFREVFGNPFRWVEADPGWLAWNDGVVRNLAEAIYAEAAFDRLPILADALEDAGCSDADLLGHLRSPGPHVRGCWALDLLLGKQ
jgi:hypothetical protein